MSYILTQFHVKDLNTFKTGFWEADSIRRTNYGLTVALLLCDHNDRNNVTVIYKTEDLQKGLGWFESAELRERAPKAGVIGIPKGVVLDAIEAPKGAMAGSNV